MPVTSSTQKHYTSSNWSAYNNSLKSRGSLTVWFSEDALSKWSFNGDQKRGGKRVYSDFCFEFCLTIKAVYGLGYRQMEGFIESIFQLSGFALPVPNNAHVCRKSKGLSIPVHTPMAKGIIDIAVDSTGVKVFGEGEWKVRKHGYDKRREWRKVH